MLKVAVVGCGKIADDHVSQIRRVKNCELVGVCDAEPLMAQQLAERFHVRRHFSNLGELLNETRPDIVHVTTPPQSHFDIAKACLNAGCHAFVEKPFTLSERDTQELIALAKKQNVKITVGHNGQFRHAARRMRALVREGFLGGPPVHMESYYCYALGGSDYAAALLGDEGHWVRRLPGKLLQNTISHGIAPIAEFLTTDSPRVVAYGFRSQQLASSGEKELIDELRVIIHEDGGATAYFTFSTQMRPSLHQFRIYGPKNGLALDQDHETLIKLRGTRFKSYAEKFVAPAEFARQHLKNVLMNAGIFLGNDFHMKSDLYHLIENFYRSIIGNVEVPIPYREILLTSRIMDAIFGQLDTQTRQVGPADLMGVQDFDYH